MTWQTSWMRYYQSIRDPSWPDCVHEDFFRELPQHIQKEILDLHNGREMLWKLQPAQYEDWLHYHREKRDETPEQRSLEDLFAEDFVPACERTLEIKDSTIYFDDFMECGGLEYGQNLPRIIRNLWPDRVFDRALEWCSGGGFAGFRLLIEGLCQRIDFMDVYRPSLRGCEYTHQRLPQRFHGRVGTHHAYQVSDLPTNTYDLVIGLPPWFEHRPFAARMFDTRRCIDQQWRSHREFFLNISRYLAPNGKVLLVEHPWGSGPDDFQDWIQQGGLQIDECFCEDRESALCYYLVLSKSG